MEENQTVTPNGGKRSGRKARALVLGGAALALAIAATLIWAFVPPSQAYRAAAEALTAGDLRTAEQGMRHTLSLTESRPFQNGTVRQARAALVEIAYRDALALEGEDRLQEAAAAFAALGAYGDAAARAASCKTELEIRRIRTLFDDGYYDEALHALDNWNEADANALRTELTKQKTALLADAFAACRDRVACGAWHTAVAGNAPLLTGDGRYDAAVVPAAAKSVFSGYACAFYVSEAGTLTCAGNALGCKEALESETGVRAVAAGFQHALALHDDGTVTGYGSSACGKLAVADWTQVQQVAAGAQHSVALLADGSVLAIGDNSYGQCDVSEWKTVTKISAGLQHTVALLADGAVLATGDNSYGQCDVSGWKGMLAVYCGANHTVGLREDYTLVATGDNSAGQCDVSAWDNVVSVACGAWHTIGLRLDGRLLAAGTNANGQCDLPDDAVFPTKAKLNAPVQTLGGDAAEFVYGVGTELGPWLYLNTDGAVMICCDDSEERRPLRADLFATAEALPSGRVTEPEASGNIIIMSTLMPLELARRERAVFAVTGDYLGFTSNRKAVQIRNGIVYYDRDETTTIALLPDGTVQYYDMGQTSADELTKSGVRDSFSFGPLLVRDGQKTDTQAHPQNEWRTIRNALGYVDPYHYISVMGGRDTGCYLYLPELSDVCIRYGCQLAYNLDGGHSAAMVFMGENLALYSFVGKKHDNVRALSDVIAFLNSERVAPAE